MNESARDQAKRLGVRWPSEPKVRAPRVTKPGARSKPTTVASYPDNVLVAEVDRIAHILSMFLQIYLINPADVERLLPRRKPMFGGRR